VVCRVKNIRFAPPVPRTTCDGTTCKDRIAGSHCRGWCFELALQEPSCLDQHHKKEKVSWMVLEEGSFISDDGALLQAGTVNLAGAGWYDVSFKGTGFKETPARISQVQTTNGASCHSRKNGTHLVCRGGATADQVHGRKCKGPNCKAGANSDNGDSGSPFTKTRQAYCATATQGGDCKKLKLAAHSFQISLETEGKRSKATAGDHVAETAGWAAFEQNHGTLGELQYEAGLTPYRVTSKPWKGHWKGHFRYPPRMFASIGTFHGRDAAEVRQVGSLTNIGYSVMIEEESCSAKAAGQTGAKATRHLNEEVDYIAISSANSRMKNGMQGKIKASPLAANLVSSKNHVKMGESGDLKLDHRWQTVQLKGYYLKPVIIAGVPSRLGTGKLAASCKAAALATISTQLSLRLAIASDV
jgi:hypothetical protein